MNDARTQAVAKLYERIANGEELTDNEYEFIKLYEVQSMLEYKANKPKVNQTKETLDLLIKYGNKAVGLIDKVFPYDKE